MQNYSEPAADAQNELNEASSALESADALAGVAHNQCTRAQQLEHAEQTQPRQLDTHAENRPQEIQQVVRVPREEHAEHHADDDDLESCAQHLARSAEDCSSAVEKAKAAAPRAPATSEEASGRREPVIFVLIDGSSAPLSEKFVSKGRKGGAEAGAQLRWVVEKDLREQDDRLYELDDPGEPQPTVQCFFLHNREALIHNFKANNVMSDDGQWDSFFAGFSSFGCNHAADIGDVSACPSLSRIITTVGRSPATTRIYLAGIYLEELYNALPDLRPSKASILHIDIVPKLVLGASRFASLYFAYPLTSSIGSIDHREADDAREALLTSGWRVTRFPRLISSSYGLGGDLGWGYRQPPSIVELDDQNDEPGAGVDGSEDVYNSLNLVVSGDWG